MRIKPVRMAAVLTLGSLLSGCWHYSNSGTICASESVSLIEQKHLHGDALPKRLRSITVTPALRLDLQMQLSEQ
jgi:hypothetical protein